MRLALRRGLWLAVLALLNLGFPGTEQVQAGEGQKELDAAAQRGIDAALRLLNKDKQAGRTQFEGSLDGQTRVTEALVAAAILAHPEQQRWQKQLKTLKRSVVRYVRHGEDAQQTWPLCAAGCFLAMCDLRSPAERRTAEDLVYRIESAQNVEGGWGHDANNVGLDKTSYPSTLMAATVQSLAVLGLMRRKGVDVDEEVIADGVALVEELQAPTGALPYGGRSYLKGYEAGRTSAGVLALAACSRQEKPAFARAVAFSRKHVDRIPKGHASSSMHVMWGALAMRAAGNKMWRLYQDRILSRVLSSQQEDGSFAPLERGTSDDIPLIGSDDARRAYVAACLSVALLAPRMTGITDLAVVSIDNASTPKPGAKAKAGVAAWTRPELKSTAACARGENGVYIATAEPLILHTLDAATGRALQEPWTIPDQPKEIFVERMQTLSDGAILLLTAEVLDERVVARTTSLGGGRFQQILGPKIDYRLVCVDVSDPRVRWTYALQFRPHALAEAAQVLHVMLPTGTYMAMNVRSGVPTQRQELSGLSTNGGLAGLPNGDALAATDLFLYSIGTKGTRTTLRHSKPRKRLAPSAFSAVRVVDKAAISTSTSGVVTAFKLPGFDHAWQQSTGTATEAIALTPNRVFLFGYDDGLRCLDLDTGAKLWKKQVPRMRAGHFPASLQTAGAHVLVASNRSDRALVSRASDGKTVLTIPRARGEHVLLLGSSLLLASPDSGLRSYSLRGTR